MRRKRGTFLNITSTTGVEVPPLPGETLYHPSKAFQEAFTNILRTELQKTNIKVLASRPGVVATNFHEQRVGYNKDQYDDFMDGFEHLAAKRVAEAAIFMLTTSQKVFIKALDVVPSAQRTLQIIDNTWNERNGISTGERTHPKLEGPAQGVVARVRVDWYTPHSLSFPQISLNRGSLGQGPLFIKSTAIHFQLSMMPTNP